MLHRVLRLGIRFLLIQVNHLSVNPQKNELRRYYPLADALLFSLGVHQ